ncbi:hypothetical protein V6N13_047519 [Hibiscus sabdariffa]
MSKTIHLHKSLSESEVSKLKSETLNSQGISCLISPDENYLLSLAFAEKRDELNKAARVVSRLGKKCNEPALLGFEHVYGDVLSGVIDVREIGFLVKDMDGMIKRMERYVNSTANLYHELEVLNELEQASKKFQLNQHEESKRIFEQKLIWQRHDVRHVKNVSLWNQTFDKSALRKGNEFGRVNGGFCDREEVVSRPSRQGLSKISNVGSGQFGNVREKRGLSLMDSGIDSRKGEFGLFRVEDFGFPFGTSPGRFLAHCLSLNSSVSRYGDGNDEDDTVSVGRDDRSSSHIPGCCSDGPKRERWNSSPFLRPQVSVPLNGDHRQSKSAAAPPSFGRRRSPDDLYRMLPTSLRLSLRTNLKSYVKNMAIYDAPSAHNRKETLDTIISWLAPLAHNMIRWQNERNFEQQQIVAQTNIDFADRQKTETAICKLLVGLNYIYRYEHQRNTLQGCASSFDFEDCTE